MFTANLSKIFTVSLLSLTLYQLFDNMEGRGYGSFNYDNKDFSYDFRFSQNNDLSHLKLCCDGECHNFNYFEYKHYRDNDYTEKEVFEDVFDITFDMNLTDFNRMSTKNMVKEYIIVNPFKIFNILFISLIIYLFILFL